LSLNIYIFCIVFFTLADDEVFGEDEFSIYIRQWHPETLTIGDIEEVVLVEEFTVENLKKQVLLHKIPLSFTIQLISSSVIDHNLHCYSHSYNHLHKI